SPACWWRSPPRSSRSTYGVTKFARMKLARMAKVAAGVQAVRWALDRRRRIVLHRHHRKQVLALGFFVASLAVVGALYWDDLVAAWNAQVKGPPAEEKQ